MPLTVTSVHVYPDKSDNDRVLAHASVVFEEEFVVHDIRLVRADRRVVAAMPSERYRGEFRDIAHPINNDCRTRIRRRIIEAYNDTLDGEEGIDVS